jgi:AcrR family transcriptional regulator
MEGGRMSTIAGKPPVPGARTIEETIDGTRLKIVQKVRDLFLSQGYHALTMTGIADACGLTRRALYYHFHGKEELLRALLILGNRMARDNADWAAQKSLARGAVALDVLAEWLDTRFGNTRRQIGRTPHGDELNQVAFSIGNDIMIEVSLETNARLAALLDELCRRGKLALQPGRTTQQLAEIIGDGARGVNQQRPPIPPGEIAPRYRRMTEAILYGCARAEE